ncbi:MAG: winged helix-turn-helix domain-containing protein [Phycisphaerae bacterium]
MTQEKVQRLADLVARLAETLMTAAVCADEVRAILRAELDELQLTQRHSLRKGAVRSAPNTRPLVDASTLSVFWEGRTCLLRQKTLFRLAERLARRPNQYITAGQLLEDVWDGGVKAPETIRSAIRHLRRRLSDAGMADLAAAIRGTGGGYGLILDGTH